MRLVNRGGGGITFNVGSQVTRIPAYLCYNDGKSYSYAPKITTVTISSSVQSIGEYAFCYCSKISTVNYNAISCTSVGDKAFYYTGNSTRATINVGASVVSIPEKLFYSSVYIKSVNFVNNTACKEIGSYAFYYYSGMDLYITDLKAWCEMTMSHIYTVNNFYVNNSLITSLVVPDGVTKIGEKVFSNFKGITSITIPQSVTDIGSSAFFACVNVTEINYNATNCLYGGSLNSGAFVSTSASTVLNVGANVVRIPAYLFGGSILYSSHITDINWLGNSQCQSIGEYAFYQSSLSGTVTLPSSIISIESKAFMGNAITGFEVSGSKGNIIVDSNGLILDSTGTKVLCAPNEPTNTVITNNNVTTVGAGAFSGSSLTYFDFPNLTTIQEYAFDECTDLTTVKFGAKVSSVGKYAFRGCTSLKTIVVEGAIGSSDRTAIPTITSDMVSSPSEISVYVAGNDLSIYHNDENWSAYRLDGVENETICTVSINLDGGEGYSEAYYILYGNTVDLSKIPTKEGYTFSKWEIYLDGAWSEFDTSSEITQDVTIKAIWSIINYNVKYHLNGGSVNGQDDFVQTFTIEDFGSDRTSAITLSIPTREGYNFVGWYSKEDFESARVVEILYNNLTLSQINGKEDIELYAKWEIITYTMTFVGSEAYTIALDNTTLNPVPWHTDFGFVIMLTDSYTQNTSKNIIVKITSASGHVTTLTARSTEDVELHYVISSVDQIYTITVEGLRKNVYNVYFISMHDGVTGLSETLQITHGDTINSASLSTPSVNGYTFKGYYQRVIIDNQEKYDSNEFDFSTIVEGEITLLADFKVFTYTITLYLNGGSLNGVEQESFTLNYTVESGITLPTSNNASYRINRLGYTWAGWYDYDGEKFGDLVEGYSIGSTGNKTVMLKWNINTYHITYRFNGGSTESEYVTTFTVTDTVVLVIPTRRGHTFGGWYTDEEMEYNKIEKISSGIAKDITIYAKWTSNPYDIVYHLNGGVYTNVTIGGVIVPWPSNSFTAVYIYDESATYRLLTPARKGYVFGGWFESENLGGNAIESIAGSKIVSDRDFYAKWTAMQYVITFDYGDIYQKSDSDVSKISITTQDIEDSENEFAIGHELSMSGYTFSGWYLDGERLEYITLDNVSNMTLRAEFVIDKMNITLLGDNVEDNVTILSSDNSTIDLDYGSDLVFKVSIVSAEYSRSNYIVSYSYSRDGGYMVLSAIDGLYTVSIVTNDIYIKIDGIEVNTYTIEFVPNGGTSVSAIDNISHGAVISEPDSPTRDGYLFRGWYTDIETTTIFNWGSKIVSDMHLYAGWETVEYTATLKNNISSETKDIQFNVVNQGSVSLLGNNFELAGYRFLGFYLVPKDTEDYDFDESDIIENLSNIYRDCDIIARFEIITYNIYYGIDAGENSRYNPTTYTVTSATITLQPATKTNFRFVEWQRADDGTTITEIATGSTGDMYLVAIFTLISSDYASVKYYANGELYSEVAVKKGDSINDTPSAIITPKVIEGYEFVGWYINIIYSKEFDLDSKIKNDVELYGKYNLITYTITYQSNVGEFTNAESNLSSVDIYSKFNLADGEKIGYRFDGWYTNVINLGGLYDFSKAERIYSIIGLTEDITIVAKFSIIKYDVTYNLNGGVLNNLVNEYTILSKNIVLGSPVRTGYTFLYWIDNNGLQISSIDTSSCVDIVLDAHYQIDKYTITYVDTKTSTDNVEEYNIETPAFTLQHNDVKGYTFSGWFNGDSKVEILGGGMIGDITLTARYELIEYKITYILDGGVMENDNPSTYTIESGVDRFNSPSKIDYTFKYWINANDGSEIKDISIGSIGDIVLQAVFEWVDNSVLVTYYIDGIKYLYDSVTKGTTIHDVQAPSRNYYTFIGWYADSELTTPYDNTTIVTTDMELHAKFVPIVYYITYTFLDQTGNAITNVNNTNASAFSVESLVEFASPTVAGYTFNGFTLNGESIHTTFGIYRNIVIKGEFSINTYSIAYVLDGGSASNPTSYTISDDVIVLNEATKEGYTFLGWYEMSTDEKITIIEPLQLQNYILIAKWQPIQKDTPTTTSGSDIDVLLTAIFVILTICAFIGFVGAVNVIRKKKLEKTNSTQLNNMWNRVENAQQQSHIIAGEIKREKESESSNLTKGGNKPFVMPNEVPSSQKEQSKENLVGGEMSGTAILDNGKKITPSTTEKILKDSANKDSQNNE